MKKYMINLILLSAFSLGAMDFSELRAQSEVQDFYKVTFFSTRKADMTQQEFMTYAIEQHAPLVMKIPNLRGYVSNFADPDYKNPTYDAIVELWFDSEEDFQQALQSTEGSAAIEDQKNFLASTPLFLAVQERTLIVPSRPRAGQSQKGTKNTYIMGVNPSFSRDDFLRMQFVDYAPTAITTLGDTFTGYEINWSEQDHPDLPVSIVIHAWFSSKEDFMKTFQENKSSAEKLEQMRATYYTNWSYMEVVEHIFKAPNRTPSAG